MYTKKLVFCTFESISVNLDEQIREVVISLRISPRLSTIVCFFHEQKYCFKPELLVFQKIPLTFE